jgi:NTE family protein
MLRRILGSSSMPPAAPPLATLLSQFAPFAGLDPSIVGELEAHSTIVQLDPGGTLFRQGEPGDALYVVVTGSVEMRIEQAAGPPHVLAQVLPGECLGEMALLARQPRTATAVAIDSASLLKLPMAGRAASDRDEPRDPRAAAFARVE